MADFSRFQTFNFTSWMGLTKENHIGAIYGKGPQLATPIMIRILALMRGTCTEETLSKYPVKEFDTSDEIYWNVIGSSRRNYGIIEARDASNTVVTTGNIGVNGTPFYVVFPDSCFADGNVIVGEKNEVYPLRILGEPRMEGTNAVFRVELMGGIMTGIPAEELVSGKRFSKEYSPVERELSRKVGDVSFVTPTAMRNEWSRIRIYHKESGSMLNKKIAFSLPVLNNKTGKVMQYNTWMHNVEWELETQFSEEKNNLIMYGRSNRNANGEYTNVGKSGNVISMGAGLREQMECGNTMWYNKFSLNLIVNALTEMSIAKLKGQERTVLMKTGERGAIQFHKEVLNTVSGWMAFQINADQLGIIQKTQSPLHTNALSAGFQFVQYMAPNGVTVKVDVDPAYDDPVRNKIQHPEGGVAESYRYDIFDIGTADVPNIQLTRSKQDPELRGYLWGLRNPFTGQVDNTNMATSEDSAEFHRMWTGGVLVFDPTRVMSIIPAILQ